MQHTQPGSVFELFADKEWKRKITVLVSKFSIKDDPEDVVSEIMILMAGRQDPEGLGRDYIQRWDGNKSGSFSNWVYTFVRNYCIKKYHRSHSDGGRMVEGALAIVEQPSGKESPDKGTIFSEWVGDHNEDVSTAEICQAIARIANELRIEAPAHSWVEYAHNGYTVWNSNGDSKFYKDDVPENLVGRKVERDMATVLEAITNDDMDCADIAKMFKTSRQFVYSLCKQLSGQEYMLELRAAL